MAFSGDFTPVLAKHTKHLSLVDILSVGVDRMQRSFEPMRKQVEGWKRTRLPDEAAKLVIYPAFVEAELDVPKHLARRVHDLYFNPQIEEFAIQAETIRRQVSPHNRSQAREIPSQFQFVSVRPEDDGRFEL